MARAAMNQSIPEIARKAGIAGKTLSRFENGSRIQPDTIDKLVAAFEAEGIEFIADGVRYRGRAAPESP